ncbi:MAG: cysteine--tRNA ligase, partial [Candidatus Aenigmarchaeota archaeon]|nr:cysteine--tRNA ligase [Candidatus Aenigmarchaeota archaeon]
YSEDVVRYMFISTHYHKKLDYTNDFADNAKNNYLKLKETFENLEFALKESGKKEYPEDEKMLEALPGMQKKFKEALADDLNNPEAVKLFHELSYRANKYLAVAKNRKVLEEILALYNEFAGVLGILSKREEKIPKEILSLAKKREDARKSKEWDSADDFRKKIEEKGYIVEDSDTGFRIKKK